MVPKYTVRVRLLAAATIKLFQVPIMGRVQKWLKEGCKKSIDGLSIFYVFLVVLTDKKNVKNKTK